MDQTNLPAHSEAKISLLKEYLNAYIPIISHDGYTKIIYFADVFCGPGMYAEGKAGSPVVIARALSSLHQTVPNAPKTSLMANDKDEFNIATVESYVRPLANKHPKLSLETSSLDGKKVIELLKQQNIPVDQKRFLFIDPFGYKDIHVADLLDLMKGKQTELLLFQPSSFMFRFSEKGTPESLSGFLSELSNGDDWPAGLDIFGYVNYVRVLFQERFGREYFVDSFTIQKDQKSVFCLFFFTPHIRGFEKMLEAKWRLNTATGRGWHFNEASNADPLFSLVAQTSELEIVLEHLLQGGDEVSNVEIYETSLRSGFLPKHANDILKSWQKTHRIEVLPAQTRKGAFYVNYDNFKNRDRKIIIRSLTSSHGH